MIPELGVPKVINVQPGDNITVTVMGTVKYQSLNGNIRLEGNEFQLLFDPESNDCIIEGIIYEDKDRNS